MSLIKSISGIRGTIGGKPGEGLSPVDVVKFTAAYATLIRKTTTRTSNLIVVGRDARLSGKMVERLVVSTLCAMGFDVVNIGMASTPTTEIAVVGEGACGGIILTASHNPVQWNALKLLNEKGEFLNDAEGKEVLRIAAADDFEFVDVHSLGHELTDNTWNIRHIRQVLDLDLVDTDAIAKANFTVAIDAVNSVGGVVIPQLLKALGVKVSYNDMVIRCVAKALTEFPMMNSSMTDTAIIQKHYVNVGMAVATDTGLLVPVIKGADKLSLTQISEAAKDLGKRTKEGGLNPDELTGGTFTVTNLGMFGVDSFTAVINAPEAGILAVGQMKKRPVVLPDDSLVVRPMMWLSLTYDHRIVDGAPAAQFLGRIKILLENPSLLL